ncbi:MULTISPECIES: lipoate--protein ligase [Clostridiaceae]|uniref:lipoate--protein ligase n=1 Tax=Clostridiaceae TaxID=31979 RepID=UPI0005528012|nr:MULTISPECIES: lipoate--protein ligase [Clostridiaceae]
MHNKEIITNIVVSKSINPWFNLALEEKLVKEAKANEIILYLWQNADTVVIGKNQNPWKECKCRELEEDGGKLARRLSGGGAVFHDIGNLNFTFAMDKGLYNLENQLQVILKAVKNLGINAEFSGRNDILADGRKFSGNAFYFGDHTCYHHGTLLVNGDMKRLVQYLTVSEKKIKSKGIDSVKSRIVNLKEINDKISIEKLMEQLEKSFQEAYGRVQGKKIYTEKNSNEMQQLYEKYSSWEFRYGSSPKFDICLEERFPWGGIEFNLKLKNAKVLEAKVYSDAMNVKFIEDIQNSLIEIPFKQQDIKEKLMSLANTEEQRGMVQDVLSIFKDI